MDSRPRIRPEICGLTRAVSLVSGWGVGRDAKPPARGRGRMSAARAVLPDRVPDSAPGRDQRRTLRRRFASRRYPRRSVPCRARIAGVPASSRRRSPVITSAGATCCYSSCGRWSPAWTAKWHSAASGTNARLGYWHRLWRSSARGRRSRMGVCSTHRAGAATSRRSPRWLPRRTDVNQ